MLNPLASNVAMEARAERTGFEWMDTAFGWIISNYNSARLLATFLGILGIANLIGDSIIYFSGPPRLDTPFCPIYTHGLAFCWLDPNPTSSFLLSIAVLTIPTTGMVLVWLRPRPGFLVSSTGWVAIWISSYLHSHCADDRIILGRESVTVFLVVLVWLLFAAFRVRTKQNVVPLTS